VIEHTGASTTNKCFPTRIFLLVKCLGCVVGVAESTELDTPTGKTLEPERIFAIDDLPVFGGPIRSKRISSVAGGVEFSEDIFSEKQCLSQYTMKIVKAKEPNSE